MCMSATCPNNKTGIGSDNLCNCEKICEHAITGVDGTECDGDTGLLHCPAGFAQAFTSGDCPQLKK